MQSTATGATAATAAATCPHGLRPGTIVCLHCRHDARIAARQRRYRLAARIGLGVTAGSAVIALIVGGLSAIASDARSNGGTTRAADPGAGPVATKKATTPATLEPRIAEGRTEWADSTYAMRTGREVTVHFDTETLRTRFDWKFESVVRTTLPLVYGQDARGALDAVPTGTLVRGSLLQELPTRGISLPLADGRGTMRIWPVTRAGRDGPIVVAYRTLVSR